MTSYAGPAHAARASRGYAPLLVMFALLAVAVPAQAQQFRVIAADASVRLFPKEDSELVATLPLGTLVTVDNRSGDWYAVYLEPDAAGVRRYGYMLVRHLEQIDKSAAPVEQTGAAPASPPILNRAPEPLFDINYTPYAKRGFYAGGGLWQSKPYEKWGFDGLHGFVDRNTGTVIAVPTLSDTQSLDLVFGWRFDREAVEIRYARQHHIGDWYALSPLLLSFDATYQEFDLDGRWYFAPASRVQPYVSSGIVFQWLQIKEGSISATLTEVGDATLTGVSFQGGGGVTVYVHPRIGIGGGLTYRFEMFTRGKGVGGSWEDTDTLYGSRMRFGATATFTF
jgi:hypothetical protein